MTESNSEIHRIYYRQGVADTEAKYADLLGIAKAFNLNRAGVLGLVNQPNFLAEVKDLFSHLEAALAKVKGVKHD